MKTSESVMKIAEAIVKASADINHATYDSTNPHFNSKFASLESVIDTSKTLLLAHGVIVLQGVNADMLVTRLQHVSGEFFETELKLILSKQDMQAMGSAITYARRYSLAAMLNISQTDDDGNDAGKESSNSKKDSSPKSTPKPAADENKKLAAKDDLVRIFKAFQSLAVSEAQLLKHIGRSKADQITHDEVIQLKNLGSEIKSGKVSAQEIFGRLK